MKEFMNRKLKEVRQELGRGGYEADEDALCCIETLVFHDKEAVRFSTEELEAAIHSLFYKTRCRLGILQPLLEDESITEIMVNGPEHIFIERYGQILRCSMSFDSAEELEELIRNVAAQVHREFNELQPIVDARLEDGSRVNGVYRNVAVNGPILTVRKFSGSHMTMEDLILSGTIDRNGADLLLCLTECRYNIFISGGTSSGKTTFLNALADAVPAGERIIVIEDSSELKLAGIDNIVHLECRNSNALGRGLVTMSQLIKSSLRMRPDRIIVGEVRGGEVLDMLQAMNTGHAGSMSTGHGNSAEGMLQRLETMYMMAMPLHVDAVRSQIAEAVDIMVHLERMEDGRRQVMEICEITGYRNQAFQKNTLMVRDNAGHLQATGNHLQQRRKLLLKGENYAGRLREMGFVD